MFLRGAILGPMRFLDSLGTALRPFFGREAVEAFVPFCLLFFPFCGSHVSSGPCTWSQEGRPAGGLARSPCPSEGKGSNALLGRRDSDPLLFVLFCVASVCFGSQGPKSLIVRWGASFGAPEALTRTFFPQVLLSLSLFLFLFLSLFCVRPVTGSRCVQYDDHSVISNGISNSDMPRNSLRNLGCIRAPPPSPAIFW